MSWSAKDVGGNVIPTFYLLVLILGFFLLTFIFFSCPSILWQGWDKPMIENESEIHGWNDSIYIYECVDNN